MKKISVSITDHSPMTAAEIDKAESSYKEAVSAAVGGNINLAAMIHTDDFVGVDAGVPHFENGGSAWYDLNLIGERAAESALGYCPGEGYHFEVTFWGE